jgi:hypothetical protein
MQTFHKRPQSSLIFKGWGDKLRWSVAYWGKPKPYEILFVAPVYFAFHVLISIIAGLLIAMLTNLGDYIDYIIILVMVIIGFLMRHTYSSFLFRFKLWLIKRNGKTIVDKIIIRTLKHALLMYVYVPIVLLVFQGIILGEYYKFNGIIWAGWIFRHFLLTAIIIFILASAIEFLVPEKVFNSIDKKSNSL